MALDPQELFQSAPGNGSQTRTVAHRLAPKVFASGAGTLPVNAPVAFDTVAGFWTPWTAAGANGQEVLKGIVYPDPIELSATGEVIGQVLLRGIVHVDDVKAATTEADADVETELREEARLLGIDVQGLTEVR